MIFRQVEGSILFLMFDKYLPMKHRLLKIILSLFVLCFVPLEGVAEVKVIDPLEFRRYVAKHPEVQIIDVREAWEVKKAKIPRSKHISLRKITAAKDSLNLDMKKPLITYCRRGVRSQIAAEILEKIGFENVMTLKGGIEAYATFADPSIPTY